MSREQEIEARLEEIAGAEWWREFLQSQHSSCIKLEDPCTIDAPASRLCAVMHEFGAREAAIAGAFGQLHWIKKQDVSPTVWAYVEGARGYLAAAISRSESKEGND